MGTVARSAARIPVRQGDVIGIDIPSGSLFYAVEGANSRIWISHVDPTYDTIDTQEGPWDGPALQRQRRT